MDLLPRPRLIARRVWREEGERVAEAAAVGCLEAEEVGGAEAVAESGELGAVRAPVASPPVPTSGAGQTVAAVLAGNIFKVHVAPGDTVNEGEPLLVVEAMKMETTVSAPKGGTISDVFVREGDVVAVGDALVAIA